jgi:hypothetical protein
MTAKKKSTSEADPDSAPTPTSSITDIKITIQSPDKNVFVHLVDPSACAAAAADTVDGSLLEDFVTLCEDILEGNADAGKLEITAANAEEVLSSKQPAAPEPTASDAGEEEQKSEDEEIAS